MRVIQIFSLALVVFCGKALAVPLGKPGQEIHGMGIVVKEGHGQFGEKWSENEKDAGFPWKREEDEAGDGLKRPGGAWKRDEDELGDK